MKLSIAAPFHQNREELLAKIAQEYELTKGSAEMAAVDSFISQMVDIGLLLEQSEEI